VNSARLDDGGECLFEVDPPTLLETTNDPETFVTLESAVGVELVLE
jgi:hypothetical protein